MTYYRDRPDRRAACEGKADLFESTHPLDHHAARQLCANCPVRSACVELTAVEVDRGNPEGTWAGNLFRARFAKKSDLIESCIDCGCAITRQKTGPLPEGMSRHASRGRCVLCDKRWRRPSREEMAARLAAEDSAYTDEQARAARNAYDGGDRSDWAIVGCRVFKRREQRRLRARREAAA